MVRVAPFEREEDGDGEDHAARGYEVPRGEPYLLLHVHHGAEGNERTHVDEEVEPATGRKSNNVKQRKQDLAQVTLRRQREWK